MLTLVHPAPVGQAPARPRKGLRSSVMSLSVEETRHLRAAIRNVARAYGSIQCLADVMQIPVCTLQQALYRSNGLRPSGTLAIRVARAGGMSVEAVLAGSLSAAGRCEACGSRLGHGVTARAVGGAS